MKMKLLAALCATIGSAGAFAACPTNATVNGACAIQNVVTTANTQYIAGASAQAQAFNAVAKSLFDVPADVIKITQGTTLETSHVAYYGIRGGSPFLVVYRNSGGSGAGLRQLISETTAAYNPGITAAFGGVAAGTEHNAISLATCTGVVGAPNSYTATCSSNTLRTADLALLDVGPGEHAPGILPPATPGSYIGTSALTTIKTGLQGFGVAVNTKLYNALVAQNLREGIPLGAGGQPSIRSADYASLISTAGNIKFASDLLNDLADTNLIRVCRRANTSGTQASSNLFFLNNVSGTQGFGGSLNPEAANNGDTNYSLGSGTQNAKDCLNDVSPVPPVGGEYRIGVVSLENISNNPPTTPAETWKFVRIDGVSPDYTFDAASGTVVLDPKQRQQFASGAYKFAYESALAYRTSPVKAATTALATQLGAVMAQSGQSDLVGFAYLDRTFLDWNLYDSSLASPANKQARGNRASNNSRPLLP
jgi:hypothetical protein